MVNQVYDGNGNLVSFDVAPTVLSLNDYYPFGWGLTGMSFNSEEYRYGFNGKEKDTEWASGTIYDYGFRIYDPRMGKFLSVDPLAPSYPWYTPYQFAGNKPIVALDMDGLEEWYTTDYWKEAYATGTAKLETVTDEIVEEVKSKSVVLLNEGQAAFDETLSDVQEVTQEATEYVKTEVAEGVKIVEKFIAEHEFVFKGEINSSIGAQIAMRLEGDNNIGGRVNLGSVDIVTYEGELASDSENKSEFNYMLKDGKSVFKQQLDIDIAVVSVNTEYKEEFEQGTSPHAFFNEDANGTSKIKVVVNPPQIAPVGIAQEIVLDDDDHTEITGLSAGGALGLVIVVDFDIIFGIRKKENLEIAADNSTD